MRSSATVPTAHARRYMIQLCKHFAHRVTARFGNREGVIDFEAGEVRLRAGQGTLMLVAEAQAADSLERLEQVLASHLKRFAFREPGLAVEWSRAKAA
jgi:hypothetical protein